MVVERRDDVRFPRAYDALRLVNVDERSTRGNVNLFLFFFFLFFSPCTFWRLFFFDFLDIFSFLLETRLEKQKLTLTVPVL